MEKKIKTRKQRKGITLIALVITIIVLLILAGITINLTIGQDGIITRAEEAGKNYTQAAEKEKAELAGFTDLTDKVIDKVTQKYHTMVNGVPVPKGFEYIEGTKETGFVIKDITTNADGTPTDTNGNEFVWVPCTLDGANRSITYARYAFTGDSLTQTLDRTTGEIKQGTSTYVFTETMPSDEESSIRTYGGFYIGRYESGVEGYAAEVSKSNSSSSTEWTGYSNGKLVIKQNQQVWNYITRDKAKKVSEGLYKKSNGDSVNSKLCSGYAWDTTLKFMETKHPTYPTNSTQGNYEDKSAELGKPAKTGLTEPVNNIYDMGGNTWEWTTETCSDGSRTCTDRGGSYGNTSSNGPAAYRGYSTRVGASGDVSFRTTLYL